MLNITGARTLTIEGKTWYALADLHPQCVNKHGATHPALAKSLRTTPIGRHLKTRKVDGKPALLIRKEHLPWVAPWVQKREDNKEGRQRLAEVCQDLYEVGVFDRVDYGSVR